jgi:hypothetical protein
MTQDPPMQLDFITSLYRERVNWQVGCFLVLNEQLFFLFTIAYKRQ